MGTLPDKATWYLATNLPLALGGPREADSPHPAASLAEITRIYGIRHWTEQGYKQVKDELLSPDFQVRSDIAIRRHQALVSCAFCFCWAAWFADRPPQHDAAPQPEPGGGERGSDAALPGRRRPGRGRCARAAPRLSPWIALQRWWPAWSKAPPPPQLQALISSVAAGCGRVHPPINKLPRAASIYRGGAGGAAGPVSAPGSASGRPAWRMPGQTAQSGADQGSFIRCTDAVQHTAVMPRARQ